MQHGDPAHDITSLDALVARFGTPAEASRLKELGFINDAYRALIEASPFFSMATVNDDGLDCSPRGDPRGFVQVLDERTVLLPERRGNNRIDSLRNLVADPRIALLFLIPGVGETLRVAGRARLSVDPVLLQRTAMGDKLPNVCIVVQVEKVFFQCARAIVRSDLWNPALHVARSSLPSTGTLLAAAAADTQRPAFDGATYDQGLETRQRSTLY